MNGSAATAEDRYSRIVAALTSRPGVSVSASRKKGFGATALCVNDKIFAMLSSKGQFVVRLPKERVDTLVMFGSGARFEASHGRPMQEWFAVGAGLEESWLPLAEEALSFVESSAHDPSA